MFFSSTSSLNLAKASSSIFTLTEKHSQKADFCSLKPEKFLNTKQEVECPSEIFTWYKLASNNYNFPWLTCLLKNESPSNSVTKTPPHHQQQDPRDSQELCEFGDHPSLYGTALLLDQYARICTCHAGLVLTKIHRKPGSPLTDTHSPGQTE